MGDHPRFLTNQPRGEDDNPKFVLPPPLLDVHEHEVPERGDPLTIFKQRARAVLLFVHKRRGDGYSIKPEKSIQIPSPERHRPFW